MSRGGPPLKSDRGAHRLALGCKLHILVSLRVFGMESHYTMTPYNSNLQGKSKQVRVIGSLKKIAGGEKKNSFHCIVNILITFNYRNVKSKLKDTSR